MPLRVREESLCFWIPLSIIMSNYKALLWRLGPKTSNKKISTKYIIKEGHQSVKNKEQKTQPLRHCHDMSQNGFSLTSFHNRLLNPLVSFFFPLNCTVLTHITKDK